MRNYQKITCPSCNKKNTWRLDNSFKPFCSQRCKLIDLGEWASETRKIPGSSLAAELEVAVHNPDDFK